MGLLIHSLFFFILDIFKNSLTKIPDVRFLFTIAFLIPLSFAYADFNDPVYTTPPLRSDQLPCNIGSAPGDDYFQYQCQWIENPRVVALSAIELFQQTHNPILLEVNTLKDSSGIHEFHLTFFKGEYIERLVIAQRIVDNTSISITLYNGTVSNPVIIADGANNVISYLKQYRNSLDGLEKTGKTIIGMEAPYKKYDVDTYLQLSSDNTDPLKESKIREKQSLLTNKLSEESIRYGNDVARKSLPVTTIGYEGIDNSLQITIESKYFTDENIPKYVEKIRSIVGDEINISLYPVDVMSTSPQKEPYSNPYKQWKSGLTLDKIQCNDDLELILKSNDGSPACVKSDSKIKLIERGWAKSQS